MDIIEPAGPVTEQQTPVASRATTSELANLAAAETIFAAAAGSDWLVASAARVEITRMSPPKECICGTPLYRHPAVGPYYRLACRKVLEAAAQ